VCSNSHVKAMGYTCLTNVHRSLSYDTRFVKTLVELSCGHLVHEVNGVNRNISPYVLLQELLNHFGINFAGTAESFWGKFSVTGLQRSGSFEDNFVLKFDLFMKRLI
jgi:hypothetical protein